MPTKEAIKRELESVNNIYEILDVMKAMASSQYAHAKKDSDGVYIGMIEIIDKEFVEVVESIKLEKMNRTGEQDPFIYPNDSIPIGIITVTSDAPFMGALNSKIVKAARVCAEERCPGEDTSFAQFLVTGRKGAVKMKFNKFNFAPFSAIVTGPTIRKVTNQLSDYVVQQVRDKKLSRLYIIAAENISFTKQVIVPRQLLPFTEVFSKAESENLSIGDQTYLETPLERVTEYLAREWLGSQLYRMLLSAKAAEFGALATQMEGNLTSVKKVQRKLSLMFKKAKNEKVDSSMREIFVSTMVANSG